MDNYELLGTLGTYKISLQENLPSSILFCSKQSREVHFVPMLSQRNVQQQARRLLDNFTLSEGKVVIVAGIVCIPLLYFLEEQRQKNGGMILVLEADSILVENFYKRYTALLKNMCLVTPTNLLSIDKILTEINVGSLTSFKIIQIPASFKIDKDFYHEKQKYITQEFSIRFTDLLTRFEFQHRWIRNSLSHITRLDQAYPVKNLFSLGRGMIALLISSGPSLRHSLSFLQTHQNKFFLACVDSSYEILLKNHIQPHLVFTLDAQPFTIRHFINTSLGNPSQFPLLYADMVANPQVTFRWQGPLFIGTTAQYSNASREVTPGCDFVENRILELLASKQNAIANDYLPNIFGDIQSGGSVATSLFDLLRQMHFEKIIFVGQDLAYTYREIHCTGTYHTSNWLTNHYSRLNSLENINEHIIRKRKTSYATSIQNKPIVSDYVLSLYKTWFESAIAETDMEVFNGTHDGLPIQMVEACSLEQALDIASPIPHLNQISYWLGKTQPIIEKQDLRSLCNSLQNHIGIYKTDINQSSKHLVFLDYIDEKYNFYIERKKHNNEMIEQLNKKRKSEKCALIHFLSKQIHIYLDKD